ncbi:MAG: hypothetical protein KKE57_02120, partial [Proteobacteria bacterium]|nr:hypothetical protein [Pseudomonadota bacterium]
MKNSPGPFYYVQWQGITGLSISPVKACNDRNRSFGLVLKTNDYKDNVRHKARRLFAVDLNAVVERSRYAAEKNFKSLYTSIFVQFQTL